MMELLAPNGKPSNLTAEQYKLVRTPAFKKWFGDWENDLENSSKVVDENGEPLILFHGTNEQFNVFNKKGKGNRVLGYFFTTDKYFSENYGESKFYFLNIKKIKNFNYEKFDSLNTRQNAENNYWQLEKDKLLEEMYNGFLIDRDDFFAGSNFVRKDYVAFEPNQIKLADGSNTTFDENNSDIRYNDGGLIENELSIIIKGVTNENKYKGNYKKIFDLIEENITFYNPYGTSFEELKNNDFYINITPKPESIIIEKISKLKGVEIINPDIRFEEGGEIYSEISKEINEVNALSDKDLTPMQLRYLNKKLLFFPSDKMNTLREINENLWQELRRKQMKVEDILNEKETKKSVAGYLNEKYVYHFTTIFYLTKIVEDKSIGNWQQLGHIISLTTNPIFGEVEVSGVKSWNQGMDIKKAILFSDLSVKIVFDLQKIKADGIKITKGSGKTGTHFGEYELIIPQFNEKDKWWKYVSWIEIDKNKKEIKEMLDYKWVKKRNIKDVMQLPIDIWIKGKQAESTLGVELKKLGIEVREREKIDVEKYLFGDKKPKYADGGLIAPNGKRSYLTPIQYELVRRPEFKAWFGDWENDPENSSKIVDTNGEPLEVYHGTDAEFNVFDGGAYFTDDYMNADGYAGGENVFHIFLNIKKPLIFNANRRKWDNLNSKYGSSTQEIVSNIDEKKYDGVIFNNINDNFWDDKGSPQNVYYAINPEQIKLSDGSNTTFDGNNPDIRFKGGGRTIAQTPAPKKDQIKGSDKNKEGSAKDISSAKKIKFSDDVLEKIQNSVDKHNKKHSDKKITIDSAKAVVRRGMGAYSSTHRPTISGGNENSRVAWGLARLNAFLFKIVNGKSKSGKYSQDNDLIEELGYKVEKYEIGGIFQGTPYDFNAYSTEYMGTGEGNQSFGWGLYFTDQKSIAERYAFTPNENSLYINGVSLKNSKQFTQEEKDTILNIWRELWQMGYSKTSNDYLFEFLNEIEQKSILWDIEDESVFDKETIIELNEYAKFYNALYDKLKNLDLQINSNVVSVTLFKGKNPNEYDLLEFNKPVNNIQINKIENQAKKEGILIDDEKELKWFRNKLQDGSMIYDWLRQQFSKDYHYIQKSADKQASLFLLRAGIDGIKYKSGTLSGFEDEEGYNYVIFDANDITIEGKEKYADGGDIQAYEEAMGISEFKEGGETKPKKVYVSITIKSESEYIINEKSLFGGDRFQTYETKPFEDLENGQLIGVIGVSSSPHNVGEWFVHRNCLIVMKYDEFVKLNDFTIIDYDNPEQLMADDMKLFNRIYAGKRDENTDEETLKGQRSNSLYNILKKFNKPFDIAIKKEPNLSKKRGLYRIQYFLNESYDFIKWILDNNYIIKNPKDLSEKIIEYHYSDSSNHISTFYGNTEYKTLNSEYILPYVTEGVVLAGNVFKSEQEIYLNNKTLNIPSDSQLFFQNQKDQKSNLSELIYKYKLREKYSIYFVQYKDVEKYSLLSSQKRTNIAQEKFNSEKKELEIKKDAVVHELLYFFLGESLKSFKEIIEKEIAEYSDSKLFYYDYDEERKEIDWYGIILVQAIINKYIEIIQNNWKKWISSQNVKDITVYSFSSFQKDSYNDLVKYFEENKSELEKINDYHNINGNWLSEYRIEYWLKKSVDDYQDMPEWIDHKELAKMYLEKMDAQMYRYYSEKEIPLISQYKDGGEIDEEEFISVELDKDLKEVYQNRAFKNIEGSDFFFSRLNIYPLQNTFTIELPNGIEIGKAQLDEKENYLINIRIDENYRRKGLGLNLYNFIEYVTGKKLKPSPIKISQEAQGLWIKRNPDIIFKDGGEADEPNEFWGTEAGGVLVYCSTTDRYLILLRSEDVLEPNTWGIISGKLDDDETNIEDAVLREVEEEVGYKLNNLIPSFIFEKTNFKFHNFVAIINEEFIPELNWENTGYKWVTLNDMPDNLHFGLKILIEKEDLAKLVKENKMENEMLIIDINMYRYNSTVNFKNKEIILKLNEPKNEFQFVEWAEENNIEFERWGDSDVVDSSWGYLFEIPFFKYNEYMKTEKFDKGGELKKGIKTEMEHKNTLSKIKTGKFSVKQGAEMIAKDHIKENDKYYTNLSKMESEFKEEGGKVQSIHSAKGDIKINLDENWYSDDTKVQLVPVSELIKFREFDRKVSPKYNQENSKDNINHLKYMFQKEGVKSPLIIEYSPKENSVLIIEGNHRLNSAIDLGMEFLPARVVLKKYGTYSPEKLKSTMKVSGVTPNLSGYIPSDLKPSVVGIQGTLPIYADGGIIEGRLHSECGDDGCGRKFQVGENGHVIEAERDEAVIVADAFDDNENYTIKGTPSEVASAINVIGGGKNFDRGATIIKKGQELEIPQLKKQATDTDVADVIDSGSIIINRRSMADEKKYEVTGTTKQIASAINSINGNGVIIEEGAEIKEN